MTIFSINKQLPAAVARGCGGPPCRHELARAYQPDSYLTDFRTTPPKSCFRT